MQTEQAFVTADLMRVISPSCVVVHLESGGVVCAHLRRGMTYAQVFLAVVLFVLFFLELTLFCPSSLRANACRCLRP